MLRERLMTFQAAERMRQEDFSRLTAASVRYMLRLDAARSLNKVARETGVLENFREFKKTTLDGTAYTLSRFWRAVYLVVRGKNCTFCDAKASCDVRYNVGRCEGFAPAINRIALSLDVDPDDVRMALEVLTDDDRAKICAAKDYREWPCDSELATLIKGLKNYARWLKMKHLNFIETYASEWQPSCAKESPLESELLAEGYRIALKYDYKLEITKVKTIALSWMHNYAVNLIKRNCTASRRSIVRTQHHVSRMGNRDEFGVTLCSIDAPIESGMSLHDTLPCTSDMAQAFEQTDFVKRVKGAVKSKKCRRYVDIVLGDEQDLEFEAWLDSQGLSYDKLSLDRISALAKSFLNVSDSKVERRIGSLLNKRC